MLSPQLGFDFVFEWTPRSIFLALFVLFIGASILPYAYEYLKKYERKFRFFSVFCLFAVSMVGILGADNLILIFVAWELTSWFSYLLIGFESERDIARRSALQALLTTMAGGIFLLMGFIIWGETSGTYSFSQLTSTGRMPSDLAFSFILIGLLTKSAQFPFHFWLPNAMAAPTPVSAYLHSATLVKAGVFVLGRMTESVALTPFWVDLLSYVGLWSFFIGAVFALRETELKRLLAYSTISAIGWILALLAMTAQSPLRNIVDLFVISHGGYKAGLFLCAGVIYYVYGVTHLQDIKGIGRQSPFLGALMSLALLSFMGLPMTTAFNAKEAGLEIFLHHESPILILLSVLGSIFLTAVGLKMFACLWAQSKPRKRIKKMSAVLVVPPMILILAPYGWFEFHWGPLMPMALSAIAFVLGAGLWKLDSRMGERFLRKNTPFMDRFYDFKLQIIYRIARDIMNVFQPQRLSLLLLFVLLGFSCLVLFAIFRWTWSDPSLPVFSDIGLTDLASVIMILAAAVSLLVWRSRLNAVLALGLSGYGLAFLFFLYGAPDLAFTQFLVETLLLILFVSVIPSFPRWERRSSPVSLARSALVSVVVGGIMSATAALVLFSVRTDDLKNFFSERSFTEAFGRNIVNVILVDFRGLDTLGEIAVIAIAGLGIWALYRFSDRKERKT